jgi:hypothetical protein
MLVKVSCHAIAAILMGAQVAFSTPVHIRSMNTNVQRGGNSTGQSSDILPGTYIVEFANDDETASAFYASLAGNGVQVQPRMDLSFRFFKGVSFQMLNVSANSSSGDFMRQMQAAPKVRNIWPARIIRKMVQDEQKTQNAAVLSAQNSRDKRETRAPHPFSPHVMTQIDKLHAEAITGKGFRIAIIDSGVDYTHPALGGCFGPGCLVEIGHDFTGDNYTPGLRPLEPDDDPMDNCVGHGTHVAGTIAAQLKGNEYGFVGAAPGAKLGAYRMWGCPATSTVEIEIAAFARAVEDGADILSYSNGEWVTSRSDYYSVC